MQKNPTARIQKSQIQMAKYSFYHSQRWRKLRQVCIDKAGGICQECHINAGTIAHHKVWVDDSNVNDDSVVWDLDNLECVCPDCHAKLHSKTGARSTMDGYVFDDEGNLVYVGNDNMSSNKP